jgi:hypothetical protein
MTALCESCSDPVGADGCHCDGHAFCASCLHNCPACLAGMRDDFYPDRTYR